MDNLPEQMFAAFRIPDPRTVKAVAVGQSELHSLTRAAVVRYFRLPTRTSVCLSVMRKRRTCLSRATNGSEFGEMPPCVNTLATLSAVGPSRPSLGDRIVCRESCARASAMWGDRGGSGVHRRQCAVVRAIRAFLREPNVDLL